MIKSQSILTITRQFEELGHEKCILNQTVKKLENKVKTLLGAHKTLRHALETQVDSIDNVNIIRKK